MIHDRWVQVTDGRDPIYCLDGIWWDKAPRPRSWHRCRPQTCGVDGTHPVLPMRLWSWVIRPADVGREEQS